MRRTLMIITALSSLFAACPNRDYEQNVKFDFEAFFAEFQENKSAWENLGLAHYCYTVQHPVRPPIWGPLLTIKVFPDREAEVKEIDGLPVDSESLAQLDEFIEELGFMFRIPLTISQLYAALEWEIQSIPPQHESPYFAAYEVVYNKDYHYPEYFFVRPVPGTGGGLPPTRITAFEDLRH
ncbi:MAG: hypothetical protein FWG99_10580 [Treponema sp.]|nr:hypothetical protein [Treponema sp.]